MSGHVLVGYDASAPSGWALGCALADGAVPMQAMAEVGSPREILVSASRHAALIPSA